MNLFGGTNLDNNVHLTLYYLLLLQKNLIILTGLIDYLEVHC